MIAAPRMTPAESEAWMKVVALIELLPSALDSQLQRDAQLTHFEFAALSMLQFQADHTTRMSALAVATNATLPRLSHVVSRLETRGLVERFPCPEDRRATNVRLTDLGRRTVIRATPEHIATARELVVDALSPQQLTQLDEIATVLLRRLDPEGKLHQLAG